MNKELEFKVAKISFKMSLVLGPLLICFILFRMFTGVAEKNDWKLLFAALGTMVIVYINYKLLQKSNNRND